ncbi:hypothetical protein Nepgr_019772 [Nepenthes gracilis]|uniref:Uncharacterized protein n=1 Tax=Nepenthes gracilis TaxID=150966 RepID=A0AAD3SXP9_NEPGR|nr:hypothetical protein Nepgr_019772 [Nepenthes gracilis]
MELIKNFHVQLFSSDEREICIYVWWCLTENAVILLVYWRQYQGYSYNFDLFQSLHPHIKLPPFIPSIRRPHLT